MWGLVLSIKVVFDTVSFCSVGGEWSKKLGVVLFHEKFFLTFLFLRSRIHCLTGLDNIE